MNTDWFQLNDYTWQVDAIIIYLRYLVFAVPAYLLFYVWKKNIMARFKIHRDYPSMQTVRLEILYSLSTLTIYALMSWLIFKCEQLGITQVYRDIETYGYPYFFFSILIMIFAHDTYFYWTHRLLHMPLFYRYVHRTHHKSVHPTPLASYSFHPIEAFVAFGIVPIIAFGIPCHPFAIASFLAVMNLINILGHLGFELYPTSFRISWLGRWSNNASNHDHHHLRARNNFGLYFTFWDRWMNTLDNPAKITHRIE
jgi:sterol desaturase/sphingolipid hydroxylase (fatty acid hydroxylase superfamily)